MREQDAAPLLAGGPGTLPLAPIGAVTEADLPGVIERLKEKLAAPRYRKTAGTLWTAVDVLMGLRYERALVEQLLSGVRDMEESVTYQAIVEKGVAKGRQEGRLEQARHSLLVLGEELFGTPAESRTRARIEAINSLEQLDQLTRRAAHVRSWEELLADAPAPEPRRGPRRRG